ncbi:MAG: DUF423 domain-containing protein [Methylobacter sp.]|nr:MAG: DUF423 domain-containing protein [Methylobacter sp.]
MKSTFLLLGALSALTCVGMGAFGAHGLKSVISPEMLTVYQTGVTYQMYHALGLIGIALIQQQAPGSRLLHWAGWLMFTGILLFSGSLYALALLNHTWLGMITPIGGVCFITAWLLITLFATPNIRSSDHNSRYK